MRRKLAGAVGAGLVLVALGSGVASGATAEIDPAGRIVARGPMLGAGVPSRAQVSCTGLSFTVDVNSSIRGAEMPDVRIGEVEGVSENGSCTNSLWFLDLVWPILADFSTVTNPGDPLWVVIEGAQIEVDYWFNCLFDGRLYAWLADLDNDNAYDTLAVPHGQLPYSSGGVFCDDSIMLDGDLPLSSEQTLRIV